MFFVRILVPSVDFGSIFDDHGNQNGAKSAPRGQPKCIPKSIWLQASRKDAKASYKYLHLGATWSIRGAILAAAGF